jgi:hypothetical protein
METTHVSEKAWLASTRQKLAERWKVEPEALRFSPLKRLVTFVHDPDRLKPPKPEPKPGKRKARPTPPRPPQFEIWVVDVEGNRQHRFRPITAAGSHEPPKDLRFLNEERLVYEVVAPPPPPAPPAKTKPARAARPQKRDRKAADRVAAKTPPPPATFAAAIGPERLIIIQPLKRRGRPVRCAGVGFTTAPQNDHVAFITGKPAAAFVSVDGAQIFPRKGRTVLGSDPVWSKDGRALAFLETPLGAPARLVLLAEYDNPNGDNHWVLPAGAHLDGARVFWAGAGKLVVGKTIMRPIFATSFARQEERKWDP